KTVATLRDLTGVTLTRGAVVRAVGRLGAASGATDAALRAQVAAAPVVTADETGWRVNGATAWLWTFVTPTTTVYRIAASRGADVAQAVLGADFSGVLVRDGWAPYRQFTAATHQTCVAHLLRRCTELLETARGRGREIPHAVQALLHDALGARAARDTGRLDPAGLARERAALARRLDQLLARPAIRHHGNRTLLAHLRRERDACFVFLTHPDIPATNWRAEQAIRPAVVNRKVWGGNRTWRGARTQQSLTSVIRTSRQQRCDPVPLLADLLRAPTPAIARLPSLAPT
ncbi:transposase IS66, partial [mine drainage metagenome]